MPPCTVRVFKVSEQQVPFREWLLTLTLPSKSQNLLAAAKIRAMVQAYFFDGPGIAILALGCTKEGAVAQADIDRAVRYRSMYLSAPAHHVVQPSVPR